LNQAVRVLTAENFSDTKFLDCREKNEIFLARVIAAADGSFRIRAVAFTREDII